MKLSVCILGKIEYQEALTIQEKLLKLRQEDKIEDIMLLLEHPPTLTMGLRTNHANIIVPVEALEMQGVNVYQVNRGGDITYHGPGQIVGYPIINLKNQERDINKFFFKIEETFIQLLRNEYQIIANRISKYPGVWIDNEKITAIGVAFKKWVSMHGFAFNVNTDLNHFKWINPCGITDKGITSLQKIFACPQDLQRVNEEIIEYFCKVFAFEPEIIDKQILEEIIGRD
ncbi:MAG: lipoyl(octanoyl) transferase LipB [Bacillota bacterium]